MPESMPATLDPEAEAFIRRLIQTGAEQRLPELFRESAAADTLYHLTERSGVAVTALRSTSLEERQLITLLKYRWGQYLHPAVNIHNARSVAETRMEHEPLTEVVPDDVHVIAGSVESGQILCYAVIRALPGLDALAPQTPVPTLRDRERPLFQVEKFHGWGIYNRLQVLPDLPVTRIRELGRFVKNQGLHPFCELSARGPVEVGAAVMHLLLGPLRAEVDAFVGDLEEGVSKQNLEFFHIPTALIRGTVPYEPETAIAFPRYQYRTLFPVAALAADLERARPRLEAIEQALSLPGKQGMLALFDLKGESEAPRSSLEPPGGLPPLSMAEVPQREIAMAARRQMLDAGVRLRGVDFLSGLSDAEAAILTSFMERIEVEAGTAIVRQGERGDDMFLIEAGQAEVRFRPEQGAAVTLAVRGPDEYVGEIGLMTGRERTADVVALTPMTLWRLGREAFVRYLAHMVEVERKITRVAARRAGTTARRRVAASALRAHVKMRRLEMSNAEPAPRNPAPVDPDALAARLDAKMAALLAEIEQSEVYHVVADPATNPRLVAAIVKYVMLEVFSYGPHVTEATFTAIGRFPKNRPELMRRMILHDLSEVDHGEMALRDFIKLGGDEAWARSRRITPESFALGATCRVLAERESPFSYLGYMYLFEALTPVLAERTQEFLAAKGFPRDAQVFIDTHAVEDIGHADALRRLVIQVAGDYPEAAAAIEYGFDCFAAVYPLPIWNAALQHARAEAAGR